MKTVSDFKASLHAGQPGSDLSAPLKSLWYDANGDWHLAHQQVDHLSDQPSAWVHAYLHRKEGDLGNADYWYRKAGKTRPALSLDEEWEVLVGRLLEG
jgi:hypothetical protein